LYRYANIWKTAQHFKFEKGDNISFAKTPSALVCFCEMHVKSDMHESSDNTIASDFGYYPAVCVLWTWVCFRHDTGDMELVLAINTPISRK